MLLGQLLQSCRVLRVQPLDSCAHPRLHRGAAGRRNGRAKHNLRGGTPTISSHDKAKHDTCSFQAQAGWGGAAGLHSLHTHACAPARIITCRSMRLAGSSRAAARLLPTRSSPRPSTGTRWAPVVMARRTKPLVWACGQQVAWEGGVAEWVPHPCVHPHGWILPWLAATGSTSNGTADAAAGLEQQQRRQWQLPTHQQHAVGACVRALRPAARAEGDGHRVSLQAAPTRGEGVCLRKRWLCC
jgi:hypothetical protein